MDGGGGSKQRTIQIDEMHTRYFLINAHHNV